MGYRLKYSVKISVLAEFLDLKWSGEDIEISSVAPLNTADSGDLTFSKELLFDTAGVAIICPETSNLEPNNKNGHLFSDSPRLDFIRALNYLCDEIGFNTWSSPPEIHPTAVIGQNVVIEDGCIIGENVIVEHNVVIHAGTRIGSGSRVRSCSSVGGDGFGFERLQCGTPVRFPHLGGVVVGSNVEIGSCTAIAKGTLGDTIIENNVKIDNLVHIAHNCLIKNGAFVIACAEISGGVTIGENAWVAPNSCTHQKITIGDRSVIGLGAVVTKSVPESTVFAGNPAKKIRDI
ncbi:MAG: hypothetical protein JXR16_03785 [Bermanella sp.]